MEPRNACWDNTKILSLFFVASLFCFIFTQVPPRSRYEYLKEGINDWDVLIFTQNWPKSVCTKWMLKNPNSTCNFPPNPDDWTIHGIWPTKFGTMGPFFCNSSLPFNIEELYGILPQLEAQWTRVENHKKHNMFWKHEWEKHGTCAAVLPTLNTEFKYFFQGLSWNRGFNMSEVLKTKGIVPNNGTVKVDQIIDAVKSVLGKNPFVSCFTHPDTKAVYLLEIRICFDKQLKLTNCDGVRVQRKYKEFRISDDFNDFGESSSFYRSPISRFDKFTSNLTDCPADSNLLFPQNIPDQIYKPLNSTVYQTPLMNAFKMVNFIQWLTF